MKTWPVLAAVIAVLALAWLSRARWLPEFETLPGERSPGPSVAAGATGDAAAPAPDHDPSADAAVRSEAGSAFPARHIRIRTVIEPDNANAANAEVLFWPPSSESQRAADLRAMIADDDLETTLRRRGQRVVADEHGVADLLADADSTVCARLGDFYGELELAWIESPFPVVQCIELQRDVTLRVQVVDESGAACPGFGVQCHAAYASRRRGEIVEDGFDLAMTDARGIAMQRHLQRTVLMPGDDVIDWSLRIGFRGEHLGSISRMIGFGDLFAPEPVRLVIPAGGTVIVEFVDADGRTYFGLPCLCDPTANLVCTPTDGTWQHGHTFRNVPLGRTWRIGGRVGTASLDATVVGPANAGDVVRTRVEVDQRRFAVVGQVKRTDGIPLASACISLQVDGLENDPSMRCYSNPSGQFDWQTTRASTVATLGNATLVIEHASMTAPHKIALEQALAPGKMDLGELVVPVPAGETLLATVEVRCQGRALTDHVEIDLCPAGDPAARPLPARRELAGAAFTFHGVPPGRPMCLAVNHRDCVRPGTRPVAPGERIIVDLMPAAELWLSFERPRVPDATLRAQLVALDEPSPTPAEANLAGQGLLAWKQVRPGHHRLTVRAADRLVYEFPDLELRAGTNLWPADGTRLDLRGLATAVFVPVAAADDRKPVQDLLRAIIPAGATDLPDLDGASDTGDWLVVPERTMDLLIAAPRFVPVRMPHPTADARVWLRRSTILQLRAPADEHLNVLVRIVEDAVRDRALRQFDRSNLHGTSDFEPGAEGLELAFAPGTVLELTAVRGQVAGPPQRVVVGDTSPQEVVLR